MYKVIFMGTPEFAVPVLQTLINHPQINVIGVVTPPDVVSSKGQVVFSPTKKRALEENITVLQPEKIRKNPVFLAQLKALSPDLLVVAAYGKILPQEILDLPTYGAINVHPSVLPKYRGASPVVGTILAGEKETGVTIIKMTAEMDAGEIIKIRDGVAISTDETAPNLIQKLFEEGAAMLSDIIIPYIENEITPIPQDDSQATYVKLLTSEDGKIDWVKDERYIERMVRAYLPWPTAWTTIDGMTMKILDADYMADSSIPKGEIGEIEKELFIGKLRINKLQLAGKNPVSGKEFLNGYRKYVGTFMI